ncbi:hypothetical protein [Marisediminicola sp. LYQ134]|uniref:hypothetical protein n=1 Tax=Marisediminicola sp. LYQ134 TaxID=3391061 RepID=UPI0039839568
MTTPDSAATSRRFTSLVFGVVALVPLALITAWWLTGLVTLEGGNRIGLLGPLMVFAVTAVLWVASAITALVLALRSGARGAPVWVASIALGLVALCFVLSGITLTI